MITIPIIKLINKKYKIIKYFSHGGSSAGTLLVKDKITNIRYVLKFSSWKGIGSSGTPWLKSQCSRLKELSEIEDGKFINIFPHIFEELSWNNNFYYVMEYFPSSSPISIYYYKQNQKNSKSFLANIHKIVQTLSTLYEIESQPVPSAFINKAHIQRMTNRIKLLTQRNGDVFEKAIKGNPIAIGKFKYDDLTHLFEELEKHNNIFINGIKHANFKQLLKLINNKEIIKTISPSTLPKYYHGDSTLRNYLINHEGEIKMIDVRGTKLPNDVVSQVDIAYEFAKMSRTFYLEIIRNNDFSIEMSIDHKKISFDLNFNKSKPVLKFIRTRKSFLKLIDEYQLKAPFEKKMI